MPQFGSVIGESLFDLNTSLNEVRITDEIKTSLINYEPRIDNLEVTVQVYPDSNEMNCVVEYEIVGMTAETQIVDVLLFPARV